MKMKNLALLICVFLAATLTVEARADFVRNGGFSGGGDEWLWYGTATAEWDQARMGDTSQVAVIVQVVPAADLPANTPWEVSFSAINSGQVAGQGISAYIDYYDNTNTLLGSSDTTEFVVPHDYNMYYTGFTFSGTTPDNANYSYGKLSFWRLRSDLNGGLRMDDVVGTIVPEPTSLGLLGFGGLTVLLRRRKR